MKHSTHNLWSERLTIGVMSELSCALEMIVRFETLVKDENRSSGNVVIAVDSRCSVVSDVKLWNEDGTEPAGAIPFPITCKDCKLARLPSSAGTEAGTPGNVSCLGT